MDTPTGSSGHKNIIGAILILAGLGIVLYNWAYKAVIAPVLNPQPAVEKKAITPPPADGPAPAPKPAAAPAPSASKPASPAFTSNIQVAIRGFEFVSETIRVKAGTKITWANSDTAGHTATSDTGLFTSKILSQGKSFEYVFNTPGTYPYHCVLHPYMKGEIIVE